MWNVTFISLLTALFILASPWATISASDEPLPKGDNFGMIEFVFELPMGQEFVVMEVVTAVLPNGAELYLELPNGNKLGSISFFGNTQSEGKLRHHIAVRRELLGEGRISVLPKIIFKGVTRVAKSNEFLGLQIVLE